jgi:hypothetical protein
MPNKLLGTAIAALRTTLETVVRQSGLTPNDPALVELKRILLGRIAELEAEEKGRSAESEDGPAIPALPGELPD